jgi:hypothetical protein
VVQKQPKIKSCLKLIFFIFQYFFKKIYGRQFGCWVLIKKYHLQLGTFGWTRGPLQSFVKILSIFVQ